MNDLISDSVEKLLAACSTPGVVRQVELGGSADALWAELDESGFLDALVPDAAGGAGLTLHDAFPVFLAAGRHALPVPLCATMLVRAVLAGEGIACPAGPIGIASHVRTGNDGSIICQGVPYGRVLRWVVAGLPGGWLLLPVNEADSQPTGVHGSLEANLLWATRPPGTIAVDKPLGWQEAGAALTAACMAGAMEHVLAATVAFADERSQFGKSIGKFQAIQQQLSVMAEQVFAARMAAELGCAGPGFLPGRLPAAAAKARASEAAAPVASIAHAVHGAMGVTAEYALQIHTRRLHEWSTDYGSAQYWNRQLGAALLGASGAALDFVLAELAPRPSDISSSNKGHQA
jgi:acyl-CoA dehydrogenase